MNEINIKEFFKIDDSHSKIRGFITLIDDGEVVRAAENMIVKSGRELMFNALTTDNADFNLKNLNAALINSGEQTTSNMNMTDVEKIEIPPDELTLSVEPGENLYLKFILEYAPKTAGSFSGIILYSGEILFSRVIFPEYSYKSEKKYTINYYIYF